MSPAEFVPVLEDTGLIVPVGEWVLRSLCSRSRMGDDGVQPLPVAVNLSARQFQLKNLEVVVGDILREAGVDPLAEIRAHRIAADERSGGSRARAERPQSAGVRLSMDDFGTGYSSLAYLKRFPLDSLKIDHAFIRDCIDSPDDASIALAIISLAHSLNLKVVAEGVETEAQLHFLRAHGCDEMQGYYFSKPLPVADCTRMLRDNTRLQMRVAGDSETATTLLLVDDHEHDRILMQHALEPAGYRIFVARSPAEAFGLLAKHAFDIVVSDHNMPTMTGVKFLARVRQFYPHALRILASGAGDSDAAADGINEAGIHKFLSKNLSDLRLCAEVREAYIRHSSDSTKGTGDA